MHSIVSSGGCMHISESFSTPIRYTPRVLVCGGGVAGIAAAIAAAREGADVLLVERGFLLGGLATAGLVTIFLPLCDGCGKQVSFGLAEELLRLSVALSCDGKRGAELWLHARNPQDRLPPAPRFEVNFNPQLFALQAEELLLRLGVRILYGTSAVAVSVRDRKIQAVMMEGKSGRFAVAPVCVIDATGDADLAALAGAPVVRFGQGNVLAAWYYTAGKNGYCLRPLGVADIPDEQNIYRTLKGKAFKEMCHKMRLFYNKYDSIQNAIIQKKASVGDLIDLLSNWGESARLGSPSRNSACKRINMLLRWMVRKDDIDLGLWQTDLITPATLYAILDTHVAQQATRMGLISYPKESWKAVLELTDVYRSWDSKDPIKYDFVLMTNNLQR